jgi:hypothetical protein
MMNERLQDIYQLFFVIKNKEPEVMETPRSEYRSAVILEGPK